MASQTISRACWISWRSKSLMKLVSESGSKYTIGLEKSSNQLKEKRHTWRSNIEHPLNRILCCFGGRQGCRLLGDGCLCLAIDVR